jgi:prophage tail gpP-like protein
MSEDNLSLTIGSRKISGWKTIRVTRGVERCPNDFDLTLTEHYPTGDAQNVVVKPGDACQVKIGGDLIITGYVNRYHPSITKTSHTIMVSGRGKCQDLVDCSAEWPGGQISGASALEIATKLAEKPYGIKVTSDRSEIPLKPIPQVNLILTESAWEIIERVCRYRGLLAYELPDGNLFLTIVGTKAMASGFSEGQNVQAASINYADDHLYSEYHAYRQAVYTLRDIPGTSGNEISVVKDSEVKRNRKMSIIAEYVGGELGDNLAIRRAEWEKSRRRGRASRLVVTTDGWRDSAGKLWTPNMLVPLSLPSMKLPTKSDVKWIISEVTYRLDGNGTTATLILMPPDAFQVQPNVILPIFPDVPFG